MNFRCTWLLALLLPLGALGGCSLEGTANSSQVHIEAARVKEYRSIQDLNNDAIAVVRVTATSTQSLDPIVKTPFTVTVMQVDQVLRGSVSGTKIKLRQLGSPTGVILTDEAPVVRPGNSYVIFLSNFTYGPGRGTDQYIPVGGSAGIFFDQNGTLKRLDPQSPNIPAMLALSDLEGSINR
jgi:hypothetical protein